MKPQSTPENPMDDMQPQEYKPFEDEVEVIASEPLATERQMRANDELDQEGEDVSTAPIPPGGSMPAGYTPSREGLGMQYSAEHGRTYAGKEAHGKILRPSANSKLNDLYA